MINRYLVAGRVLLTAVETDSPRVRDEVCIEGTNYRVDRVVRHLPLCPPDSVHIHLVLAEAEQLHGQSQWGGL